jgi:hypothetical protein
LNTDPEPSLTHKSASNQVYLRLEERVRSTLATYEIIELEIEDVSGDDDLVTEQLKNARKFLNA